MKKSALAYLAAVASISYLLGAQGVSAASTDELRAKAYFNAIAGGNADTIASFYAEQAEFHWVGGPLAGIYKGKTQIKSVWQKFGEAAGDMKHQLLEISESQNGKISTVTARVKFIGPKEVPVKFILMYENGKITNEIWQVDKPDTATYAKDEPETADSAAAAAAATAAEKIAAATQSPVEQPAETALPPVDRTASEKPREVIATITTSPTSGSQSRPAAPDRQERATPPEDERDAALDGPPAPEKRTAGYLPPEKPAAEKKAANSIAPEKKAGDPPAQKKYAAKKKPSNERDYYDDDDDDYYYEEYRPRRYHYGYYRPYRPYYGYGYGLGFRLGYGPRYYGRGGY